MRPESISADTQMDKLGKAIFHILKITLLGFALLIPIIIINQWAIQTNVRSFPDFPWAFIFVLITLGLYWQLATGKEYPFGTSLFRKTYSMTGQSFSEIGEKSGLQLGFYLLLFVYAVNAVGFGIVGFDDTVQLSFINSISSAPALTALFLFLGTALTAGIVEEIVFRGFIQQLIQERFGAPASFIFVGVAFTLVHFLPSMLLLQYFIVSLAFSWVAYKMKSVMICIVVHALFDFLAFLTIHFKLTLASSSFLQELVWFHVLLALFAFYGLWYTGYKIKRSPEGMLL